MGEISVSLLLMLLLPEFQRGWLFEKLQLKLTGELGR